MVHESFDQAARLVPRYGSVLLGLPGWLKEQAFDIHIKAGQPIALWGREGAYFLNGEGHPVPEAQGAPCVSREELREFHALVWDGCVRDFGSAGPAVHRLKELWSYLIHMFAPCAREYKALCKARRPEEYLDAAQSILADVPLADNPSFGG